MQINISPTSGVLEYHGVRVHKVLNIGTDRRPRKHVLKTFVEKYDTVTAPSGEGQNVRKEMTVQVEQWWNSSDVDSSLREENVWSTDDTVAVVGKRKNWRNTRVWSTNRKFLINVCLPSCLPPDTRRERSPGISLRRVKRRHRHVLSSVWDHLFPQTELLSLN